MPALNNSNNSGNQNSDPYVSIVPNCTICKEAMGKIIKPCQCNIHLKCFVDTLIKQQSSRCPECGIEYGNITIDLQTTVSVFEKYVMKLVSGLLFIMPIFLCNLGMDIVNVFDIITWHIIRMPIFKSLDIKKHLFVHVISMLIPILIGMTYVPQYGYHKQYMYGIHFITSYVIDLTILITHVLLFICSNLLIILILCIDINQVFITIRKLTNHITIVF